MAFDIGQTSKMHLLYGTYSNKVYIIQLSDIEFENERVQNNVIHYHAHCFIIYVLSLFVHEIKSGIPS